MERTARAIRSAVVEQLRLLADLGAQREYARRVPIADVPSELACGWFDDTYHPSSPGFTSAFTPDQLHALAAFTESFDAILKAFGGSLPDVETFHSSDASRHLASAARSALASLE